MPQAGQFDPSKPYSRFGPPVPLKASGSDPFGKAVPLKQSATGFDPSAPYKRATRAAPRAAAETDWSQYEEKPQDKSAPTDWSQYEVSAPSTATSARPGFFARTWERLGLTQHPLAQAESELGALYHHPLHTLKSTGENALSSITGVPPNADWSLSGAKRALTSRSSLRNTFDQIGGVPAMVLHPIRSSGGDEFAQDVADRNYRGAAGTLAGDLLPIAIGLPETREGIGLAAGKARAVASDAADATRFRTARGLRTEGGTGSLRPGVRLAAGGTGMLGGTLLGRDVGLYGGAAGMLTGYGLGEKAADAFIPRLEPWETPEFRATARNEMYSDLGERAMRRGGEQAAADRVGAESSSRDPLAAQTVQPIGLSGSTRIGEGRAATWSTPDLYRIVRDPSSTLADRQSAIGQMHLRGLSLPPNARYIGTRAGSPPAPVGLP